MIHVVASIIIQPGQRDVFLEQFKPYAAEVLNEVGCIEYIPTIDANSGIEEQKMNDSVVTVLQKWETMEDLYAHLGSADMADFFEENFDLVEDMHLSILQNV